MSKGREARRSREEVEGLLGKRTPLPGGDKQLSPQMKARPPARAASDAERTGVNPAVSLDPKRTLKVREEKAGLYAKGGVVRGGGCASKGVGKGTMR